MDEMGHTDPALALRVYRQALAARRRRWRCAGAQRRKPPRISADLGSQVAA
jgi:hypothetical protein